MSRGGPGLYSQGFFYWPSMEKRRPSDENRRLSCPALPTHHFRARPPPHAEENWHPMVLISGTPRRCKAPA